MANTGGTTYINFAQLQAFNLTNANVALNMPATFFSTGKSCSFTYNQNCLASYAVNGLLDQQATSYNFYNSNGYSTAECVYFWPRRAHPSHVRNRHALTTRRPPALLARAGTGLCC